MTDCKFCSTPDQPGLYLSENTCPSSHEEQMKMAEIPYRELVEALNYIATRTRPDISYSTSQLCRFMSNPGHEPGIAAKRVVRYLAGTATLGITFSGSTGIKGYCDSDWAGEPDHRRSTSGFIFTMSGGPISWKSQRQKTTALSALEAEYVALSLASREATWLKALLDEIDQKPPGQIAIFSDSQGALSVAKNRRTDTRTKHIGVRYHFTRDKIEDNN